TAPSRYTEEVQIKNHVKLHLCFFVAYLLIFPPKVARAECSDIREPYYCQKQICQTCYNGRIPYQCYCQTNNYVCGYNTRTVCSGTSGGNNNLLAPRAPPVLTEPNDY